MTTLACTNLICLYRTDGEPITTSTYMYRLVHRFYKPSCNVWYSKENVNGHRLLVVGLLKQICQTHNIGTQRTVLVITGNACYHLLLHLVHR